MNLLALTNDNARRIVRLSLSAEVQTEVMELFAQQEGDFRKNGQTSIPFDGKYKPDDGECLIISEYDDIDRLHDAISNPQSVPKINIDNGELENIRALIMGRVDKSNTVCLIQAFDKRKVLSTKGKLLVLSGDTFKSVDGRGLVLDSKLAAILSGKELRFFSFHTMRSIFDLSKHYVEATNDDIKEFANKDKIKITDLGVFEGVSDSWVRRKLALVMQSGILDSIDLSKAKIASKNYGINIFTENVNGKEIIVVPQDKADLKRLLRFLDQDYFNSILSDVPHLSSSKRKL